MSKSINLKYTNLVRAKNKALRSGNTAEMRKTARDCYEFAKQM